MCDYLEVKIRAFSFYWLDSGVWMYVLGDKYSNEILHCIFLPMDRHFSLKNWGFTLRGRFSIYGFHYLRTWWYDSGGWLVVVVHSIGLYQGGLVWGQILLPASELPPPTNWGWSMIGGQYTPYLSRGTQGSSQLPEAAHNYLRQITTALSWFLASATNRVWDVASARRMPLSAQPSHCEGDCAWRYSTTWQRWTG